MTDHKALIADARMFAEARGERRDTAIVSRLADALEAATDALERVVLDEYTAAELAAGVRSASDYLATLHPGCPGCDDCTRIAMLDLAADGIEELSAERVVVEAQALEQAADDMERSWRYGLVGNTFAWLRARAVEIREGRQ